MDDQDIDQANVQIQKFPASPFDEENADIILRTSDKVDFRVYSIILSLASPFFKDTFTLPQPEPRKPDANVIDLAEDSVVIDRLLRFCYPGQDPTFKNARELSPVIDALAKYTMDEVLLRVQKVLSAFSESEPVRVFAISRRYKWENMALLAARHALNRKLPFHYVDELECIPTLDYHLLIDYHTRCSGIACDRVDPCDSWEMSKVWWHDNPCDDHRIYWSQNQYAEPLETRTWYKEYLERLRDNLRSRPSLQCLDTTNTWALEAALDGAMACAQCRQVAHGNFRLWANEFLLVSIKYSIYGERLKL